MARCSVRKRKAVALISLFILFKDIEKERGGHAEESRF